MRPFWYRNTCIDSAAIPSQLCLDSTSLDRCSCILDIKPSTSISLGELWHPLSVYACVWRHTCFLFFSSSRFMYIYEKDANVNFKHCMYKKKKLTLDNKQTLLRSICFCRSRITWALNEHNNLSVSRPTHLLGGAFVILQFFFCCAHFFISGVSGTSAML